MRYQNASTSRDASLTGTVGTNQTFLVEVVFGNGSDASRRGIYVNGTKYSLTDIDPTTNFDWSSSPDMRIGRIPDWSGASGNFDYAFGQFQLGEMILFDGELSQAEREKVEGYLMHKFSIQNALPSNHPYIGSAPTT